MAYKSVENIINMDEVNVNTLKDASELIKHLIKNHSTKEVLKKTGLDKNVIYRLENEQNVTLENFLKIKKAFPDVFNKTNESLGKVPIIGQIIGDNKVRTLNPSQPTEFTAPITLIKRFKPLYAYINVSETGYNSCAHIFSTADIEYEKINNQCLNRLILMFPKDTVYFGYIEKCNEEFCLRSTRDKKSMYTIPEKNNIQWAKWICMLPFSMMEYSTNSEAQNEYKNTLKFNDKTWDEKLEPTG